MGDFYKKLGVSEDASEQEIKKAFRKLSLEFHPDRNKHENAQSKFQEINEAYETLGDPDKRREYDNGTNGFPDGMGFPGGGGFPFGGIRMHHSGGGGGMPPDINNIFEQIFANQMAGQGGGGGFRVFHNGRPVQQKPPPLEKQVLISLEKAFEGFSMAVELETQNGSERVGITVPRGINHKECIVIPDKGHYQGDMKGDLHLIFEIEPHSFFKREGQDLLCKKTISLKEALCGFSVEVPHLNGKMLRMTNQTQNSVVKPGYRREVPGFGMIRSEQTGKMIIEFDVLFPESITPEQRQALSEIL